jgi:hypothetical protein
VGVAEGLPRDQWRLRRPAEILALKICDMAMGSASFNVQADRYLAELLVEAWENEEKNEGGGMRDEVSALSPQPSSLEIPHDPDDRLVLARRLIAERCLYGVDKNPMAVEIAKLSMWLVTMAKDRPFTFLDHAFKCGDSLVGADEEMFERWAHGLTDAREMTLFDETLRDELDKARSKRRELESFVVNELRDAERKAALLAEAEAAMSRVKLGCDLIIGTRLLNVKPKEKEARLNKLLMEFMAKTELTSPLAQEALEAARKVRAFHWPFEFPEVFEQGGFSAFVGNPPFIGGKRISTTYGEEYHEYLKSKWSHTAGSADLCAYFFLRAFENLRDAGTLGLIATNTIAQGDTREVGLDFIVRKGGTIYDAVPSLAWPGLAAVFVSVVHVYKGRYTGEKNLDGRQVAVISTLLDRSADLSNPMILLQNEAKSHIGSVVLGLGFTVSPEEAQDLIKKNPKNREVLFPYLIGQEIYASPESTPNRWIINFFDWSLEQAEAYPDCMKIVRERVYPERKDKPGNYSKLWWQYGRRQERLYEAIAPLKRVLIRARTSKTHAPTFVNKGMVYSEATVVFAFDDYANYAVLQSTPHEVWAWKYSSTLKTDLRYSPSDCFQTFPFPQPLLSEDATHHATRATLDAIGERYHEHRRQIMLARQEGLTKTYNRFHDADERSADIARLRDLHKDSIVVFSKLHANRHAGASTCCFANNWAKISWAFWPC